MTLKRNRISIEVFASSASPKAEQTSAERADEAVLILARLIGRQIAREQFERKIAAELRARKKISSDDDA